MLVINLIFFFFNINMLSPDLYKASVVKWYTADYSSTVHTRFCRATLKQTSLICFDIVRQTNNWLYTSIEQYILQIIKTLVIVIVNHAMDAYNKLKSTA